MSEILKGEDIAIDQIERLEKEKAILEERLTVIIRALGLMTSRNIAMHDNLTATQARCTELLQENRALKRND